MSRPQKPLSSCCDIGRSLVIISPFCLHFFHFPSYIMLSRPRISFFCSIQLFPIHPYLSQSEILKTGYSTPPEALPKPSRIAGLLHVSHICASCLSTPGWCLLFIQLTSIITYGSNRRSLSQFDRWGNETTEKSPRSVTGSRMRIQLLTLYSTHSLAGYKCHVLWEWDAILVREHSEDKNSSLWSWIFQQGVPCTLKSLFPF